MPNDDLGQFPSPTSSMPPLSDQPAPAPTTNSSPIQEPITNNQELTAAATFEETPDEIPSASTEIPTELPSTPPEAVTEAPLEPIMATTTPTPKGGSSFGPFLAIILLLISGVALAVAVFLFSQSQQLKKQLAELTQTLEQQRTTITPTPTPTIIEFPVSAPTPDSTESAAITLPTPTATLSSALLSPLTPLADAAKALKVAINHLPNAQLIIIKTENATSPTLATTKYFFRQDLTIKKYFYVLVAQSKEPEVLDKAIYVTPDNDIPSLNDAVLGNTLGLDLKEALEIAGQACISQLCTTAAVKAQYIQAGLNRIWQLTFTPAKTSQAPLIIQINAATKEVFFKSTGF